MSVAKEFEAANANYVASFTKSDLQLPPQRFVDNAYHPNSYYNNSIKETQDTTDPVSLTQKGCRGSLHGCTPG
jgi:hypothetical protein